ncbi:MAG TPA: molybdopterin-dependent oxidoreductase [Pirellulaceae bacterium]|nr:molybdopterin-dependent oxidoreductase [Pirellulaceae bacterium]
MPKPDFVSREWSRRAWLQAALSGGTAIATAGWLPAAFAQEAAANKKGLIVLSQEPFNAEPALDKLVAQHLTPLEHFYVRNHGPIPDLKTSTGTLSIEGLVEKPGKLSLAQIKERFEVAEAEATLTCAGNRRREFNTEFPDRKVGGVQWEAGAIGNARWRGAWLADVLQAAGVKPEARHVWFEGADPIKEKDGSEAPFGGSIPIEKAMRKADGNSNGALLAWQMNGQPLSAEHGAPLRTVVPGFIGARSIKWLKRIVVSDRPSPNHYVAEAYKIVQSDSHEEAHGKEPIYPFVINAAFCLPAAGKEAKAGMVRLAGYALPTGDSGARIEKIEIRQGDQVLAEARFEESRPDCWTLWQAEVKLAPGKPTLAVVATDSAGKTQPQRPEWNFKGYNFNGWHKVGIKVSG